MSTRFRVDLLHPGEDLRQVGWVARSWEDWFTGPDAAGRLAVFALGCFLVLVLGLVMGLLLPSWRLSSELSAVPALRQDLAKNVNELNLLRSNFEALGKEASQQLRWGELLSALGRETPRAFRLQIVEATRLAAPAVPGQQAGTPAQFENVLRIEGVTPARPGSPPLLEVAQFMAELMRDPEVDKRFQLRSWNIKPMGELLSVSIVLAERSQSQ